MLVKKTLETAYHRNGISGAGFSVIRFIGRENNKEMLAILFDTPKHCAVICLEDIEDVGVKFGENSWRGDNYETELRDLIERKGTAYLNKTRKAV